MGLDAPIEPLEAAGLLPSVEQLELFAAAVAPPKLRRRLLRDLGVKLGLHGLLLPGQGSASIAHGDLSVDADGDSDSEPEVDFETRQDTMDASGSRGDASTMSRTLGDDLRDL